MAPFIMKELDRNILLSPNTEIDITGLPTKQYYMVIRHTLGRNASISSNGGYELNADGGANYAIRRAYIGDTGSTDVNFNDLDFSSSDPVDISVTLRYDYAILEF